MFYELVDPFNTEEYAQIMVKEGFKAFKINGTNLFVKKTILGNVGLAYYPMERFKPLCPYHIDFLKIRGFIDPFIPNPSDYIKTDYTFTVHVDLENPTVNKDRRWGIRKAVERGASCYIGTSRQDFEDFWNIYKNTTERAGIPARKKEHLEKVFSNHDLSKLFIVEADEEPIGAYLTVFSKEVARFYYGGFYYAAHYFHPNELGHGFILNHFQEQGLKVYDMGGAGKTPKNGDFKFGWGKFVKIYHCQLCKSWLLRRLIK